MIKNWNPDKVKRDILNIVEQNAEPTGIYLQKSARARLYAVQDPAWGAGYRRKILARLITHEIERRPNEVVLRLGMLSNPALAGYVTVSGSRHMGFYIEMGSRKFPPHPYLRPTVFGNKQKIAKMLTAGLGKGR